MPIGELVGIPRAIYFVTSTDVVAQCNPLCAVVLMTLCCEDKLAMLQRIHKMILTAADTTQHLPPRCLRAAPAAAKMVQALCTVDPPLDRSWLAL